MPAPRIAGAAGNSVPQFFPGGQENFASAKYWERGGEKKLKLSKITKPSLAPRGKMDYNGREEASQTAGRLP
ncbi:hypothetical protein H7U37_01950 [Pseudoflavonifractor phocaeensis]|uniref:hypothetical protein n=1 Tax=Pseudoflavonifractor phocaeensis TaxID=1870988 RepID=UPI00195C0491|nr:hypothetical protein [Pseudoflavonifractor phocaeensis]MBM6937290.1 hypothetical protein [Pseudoflavonifractor phocaeensis]